MDSAPLRRRAATATLIAAAVTTVTATFCPLYRFHAPQPQIAATYSAWSERGWGVNGPDELRGYGIAAVLAALALITTALAHRLRGRAWTAGWLSLALLGVGGLQITTGGVLFYGYDESNYRNTMLPTWGIAVAAAGGMLGAIGVLLAASDRPIRTRTAVAAGAALALTSGAVALLLTSAPYRERSLWMAQHACLDLNNRVRPPDVTEQDAILAGDPYGGTIQCRVLRFRGYWSGPVDASEELLVQADRGWIVLRVAYRDVHPGSELYLADAVEIDPASAPGLSGTEAELVLRDIAARGGLRPGVWHLAPHR